MGRPTYHKRMIITLEGASAVGKTTTSQTLVDQAGAYAIPEVNALFTRPQGEDPHWYLQRQADRWQIAQEQTKDHPIVVLDGDVFQPLWYNWTFEQDGFPPLEFNADFYRPLIRAGKLEFPSHYFVLLASEPELRRRKESDPTRSRRGFEKHLRLIDCQAAYFRAMNTLAPGLVHFIEATSMETTQQTIAETVQQSPRPVDHPALFEGMVDWLARNPPPDSPTQGA